MTDVALQVLVRSIEQYWINRLDRMRRFRLMEELPFRAVDISQVIQEQSVQKVIHEVRWLPPDPNDKSVEIQHQDD
jgi:hypothetical protein